MDNIRVQLNFTVDTPYGQYSDALYFPLDQWATTTQEQIDTMKQERVDNWIAVVTQPPIENNEVLVNEPTDEVTGG